jgi:hypothetical protein
MTNHDPYVLAAIAALVLFALYRRFRRLFGRQPLQPARLKARVVALAAIAGLFALRGLHSPDFAAAVFGGGVLGGGVLGAALAWFGIRLTRFEATPQGVFYTPSGYIGIVLASLLASRLAYRFAVLYPSMQAAQAQTGDPFAAYRSSPLTIALFAIVIGYYLAYCVGLIVRGGALRGQRRATDQPADAASPPSAP